MLTLGTRRRQSGTQLNCFSPPIMVATFVIEICLALYTVWRYKLDTVGRLVCSLLVFLALFQLSEYFVCGGYGMSAETWARVGFASITTLPPLGLHLMFVLAKRPGRLLVSLGYASALAFIAYFLLHSNAFSGQQCAGNYVIFQLTNYGTMAFSLFYYGWLLTTIGLGLRWARSLTATAMAGKSAATMRRRQAILGLVIGYLVFLVPTAVVNGINPETISGIPSIMCGFAVLFAVILVFHILPRSGDVKTSDAARKT